MAPIWGSRCYGSLLAVLGGLLIRSSLAYNIGAPDSACSAMLPGHSHPPKTGTPPAEMTANATWVAPGRTVNLALTGVDNTQFKGFVMQARDAANPNNQVGSFIASDEAKYMTCGRGIHNSLTHRSSAAKDKVTATWLAPSDFSGEVVFVYTFLSDYVTYWVKQKGPVVKVSEQEEVVEEVEELENAVQNIFEAFDADKETKQIDDNKKVDEVVELTTEDVPEVKVLQDDQETHQHNFLEVLNKKKKVNVNEKTNKEEESERLNFVDYPPPQPSQKAEKPFNLAVAEDELSPVDTFTPIYISSTTTLRTTTTTTTPKPEPVPIVDGVLQHTDPQDDIYIGCNSTKACFGIPDNCVASGKCVAVVAYYPNKLKYEFEMKAKSPGYVSLGFSRDAKMGEDLTTNCMLQANGSVDISNGYNYGKRWNKAPQGSRREDGITERKNSGRRDGWIHCSWTRNRSVVVEREIWDMEKDKYFLMLAVGHMYDSELQMHSTKAISALPLGLGEVGLVQAKSRLYIILHGSFMIVAWIFAASLGIMISRYFKQTWTDKKMFGLDQWFIWHRTLMILVWALSIIALVLIVVDVDGITPTIFTNPHAIMGFVTVGLAFLQPFLALLRCNPMHPHRWIFNWLHWFIGNFAQILAMLCLFFAVDLEKAQLPRPETDFLLIGFVAFHFVAHLFMSCLNCVSDSKAVKQSHMKYPPRGPYNPYPGVRPYSGHPYPDYEELKNDHPGACVRKFGLTLYTLVNFLVTGVLVILVVLAPTRPALVDFGVLKN